MVVATVRAMKMNGGVLKSDLDVENVAAVKEGCSNLGRHIENMKSFGTPVIVAINHFVKDTDSEINAISDFVKSQGSEAVVCKHWANGSDGTIDLAKRVVHLADSKEENLNFFMRIHFLY